MKLLLGVPIPDAPAMSAIGAAIGLIAALEALPGIDHRSTAIGLTTALVLVGTSVASGLAASARRGRDESESYPQSCSPTGVPFAILLGFVYAALCGFAISAFKSAWILDAELMVTAVLLGSAFAAALGALLGVTRPGRRRLGDFSLITFFVLFAPVPVCCREQLPKALCRVVAWWPSVALTDLLCAAFEERSPDRVLLADRMTLLAATGVLLAAVVYRTARRRVAGGL